MNNQTNYRLTRWTLGIQTLLLFCLADGLVVAYTAGIATPREAAAFLGSYVLICLGILLTTYLTESGRALAPVRVFRQPS